MLDKGSKVIFYVGNLTLSGYILFIIQANTPHYYYIVDTIVGTVEVKPDQIKI